jgi:hypothetical protein
LQPVAWSLQRSRLIFLDTPLLKLKIRRQNSINLLIRKSTVLLFYILPCYDYTVQSAENEAEKRVFAGIGSDFFPVYAFLRI